ncbi:MAG: hypothetical protein KOO69_03840 [Victivallales bacterium]|nr:hypothetical protein [Victivallales bacterium]
MHNVTREKFAKLMDEIEELEDKIESKENADNISVLREELIEKRNELQRLSDGCGHSHNN